MTEPDEALLWAREQAKQLREAPNNPTRDLSAEIDVGMHDDELSDMAHGYRAGAAASAERIKELEAELKDTEQDLHDYLVELGRLTSALNKGHRESVLIGQQMSAERIKELEARVLMLQGLLEKAVTRRGFSYDELRAAKAYLLDLAIEARRTASTPVKDPDQ